MQASHRIDIRKHVEKLDDIDGFSDFFIPFIRSAQMKRYLYWLTHDLCYFDLGCESESEWFIRGARGLKLVSVSHKRCVLGHTVIRLFRRVNQRISEGIPVPDSLWEKNTCVCFFAS